MCVVHTVWGDLKDHMGGDALGHVPCAHQLPELLNLQGVNIMYFNCNKVTLLVIATSRSFVATL